MRWPIPSLRRTTLPHTRVLACRWLLWCGLTAASSRFLVTVHQAGRERGHAMPSHELLFPTDDLRSQHNSSRVHTAPGLLVAFFSHATRLASANQVIFCRIVFKKYISISSTFKLILMRMFCRLSLYTLHSRDSYAFLPYEDS
jgi:hypothetical protein